MKKVPINHVLLMFYHMAYKLKRMSYELDQANNLTAKLEIERDNLISPYRLSKEAERMGMRPAESGQQRKIVINN